MANRRFAVHEIRHVIARMRLGESDRQIAKAGLIGRLLAQDQGWLTRMHDAFVITPGGQVLAYPESASGGVRDRQPRGPNDGASALHRHGFGTAIYGKRGNQLQLDGYQPHRRRFSDGLERFAKLRCPPCPLHEPRPPRPRRCTGPPHAQACTPDVFGHPSSWRSSHRYRPVTANPCSKGSCLCACGPCEPGLHPSKSRFRSPCLRRSISR